MPDTVYTARAGATGATGPVGLTGAAGASGASGLAGPSFSNVDSASALDLTQDVFLKAYQNLRKLDDPGRFAPWLYRIAHNEAYSMFRKRRPEADVDEIEPEATDAGITVGGNSVFPIELNLAVASALGRLSPDQREAVVLKIYQGFKFDEMSEILACPVSTVKSRLYTALELLKVELAPVKARGVS